MAPTTIGRRVALEPLLRAAPRFGTKPSAVPVCAIRAISKQAIAREMRSSSKMDNGPAMSSMHVQTTVDYWKRMGGPLFPGTFVTLPLSEVPTAPREFLRYYWTSYKVWLTDYLSMLSFKLRSMESWTSRPQWKPRRSQIAPTATSLYREVLEAFAAGDEKTLQRLCVGQFSSKLVSAIEKRNPKEITRFQLVKQTKPLFYPKLKTHRLTEIKALGEEPLVEQAVVALSSRQKTWKEDRKEGNMIPGSLKFQDMLEYVVLSRGTNTETWQSGPWRVWGTTTATALEDHDNDTKTMEEAQMKRAGWDKKYPQKK